jgi:hypothetical protein
MGVATDLAAVRSQLDEIERLALDETRRDLAAPDVSGWAVAEQLHHVVLVLSTIAVALKRLAGGKGDEGGVTGPEAKQILGSGRIPRGVATAPAGLEPKKGPEPEELIAAVEKAKARFLPLAEKEDAFRESALSVPHPLLGPMTAAEWVRFAAVHNAHHLRIVDDIVRAAAGD